MSDSASILRKSDRLTDRDRMILYLKTRRATVDREIRPPPVDSFDGGTDGPNRFVKSRMKGWFDVSVLFVVLMVMSGLQAMGS